MHYLLPFLFSYSLSIPFYIRISLFTLKKSPCTLPSIHHPLLYSPLPPSSFFKLFPSLPLHPSSPITQPASLSSHPVYTSPSHYYTSPLTCYVSFPLVPLFIQAALSLVSRPSTLIINLSIISLYLSSNIYLFLSLYASSCQSQCMST